jgi:xylulokinase
VLATPIDSVNSTHGAAYGAALLAGVGAGVFRDVADACRMCIRETGRCPVSDAAKVYARDYSRFTALYPALRDQFAALGGG